MSRACIRVIALLVQIVLLAGVVTGCGSRSSVVKKSRAQLAAMEDQANAARQCVWAGHCHEAIATFENLVREQHVSQPLYQMELAVACLAAGEDEKAFRALRAAQVSVEWLFDEASEKKAASLWGGESEKVYKGEAHERCSLFFLLGLMMLERGETDNALACFKSALLQDSDVEKDQYKSDYGLLHLMAAKCYELRDESEQRVGNVLSLIASTREFQLA